MGVGTGLRLDGFGICRFNRLQNFESGAEFGVCVCDPDLFLDL